MNQPICLFHSTLRKSVFVCGLFLLLFLAASAARAQGGGKAEPNRIEFKRGASSTTISGVVRNDEEAEYVLSAQLGQRLIIKLTNVPAKSSCFDLKGPDGSDVGLETDCNWSYSKVLQATGDFFITVARPSQARGRSRYRLTVTVR
ncbi:MAG TPA: hypothetical protein VFZ40_10860 [Pyrinomonadaceae bacterium]